MKRFVHSLLLLVVASAVFFTGAGVTIMNYCCTMCSEQTLFVSEHACGQERHHSVEKPQCCVSDNSDICENSHGRFSDDKHCSASRLSFDLDASMSRPHVSIPFLWLTNTSISTLALQTFDTTDADLKEYTNAPPKMPPRSYLSLIRVLII